MAWCPPDGCWNPMSFRWRSRARGLYFRRRRHGNRIRRHADRAHRSARLIVLCDPAQKPHCKQHLVPRMGALLQALNSGSTKLEHLRLASYGLRPHQVTQLKRYVQSMDDLKLTSLRLCEASWSAMHAHLRWDGLRILHIPTVRCLYDLRQEVPTLEVLRVDYGEGYTLRQVSEVFPRLRTLILDSDVSDDYLGGHSFFDYLSIKELTLEDVTVGTSPLWQSDCERCFLIQSSFGSNISSSKN